MLAKMGVFCNIHDFLGQRDKNVQFPKVRPILMEAEKDVKNMVVDGLWIAILNQNRRLFQALASIRTVY